MLGRRREVGVQCSGGNQVDLINRLCQAALFESWQLRGLPKIQSGGVWRLKKWGSFKLLSTNFGPKLVRWREKAKVRRCRGADLAAFEKNSNPDPGLAGQHETSRTQNTGLSRLYLNPKYSNIQKKGKPSICMSSCRHRLFALVLILWIKAPFRAWESLDWTGKWLKGSPDVCCPLFPRRGGRWSVVSGRQGGTL